MMTDEDLDRHFPPTRYSAYSKQRHAWPTRRTAPFVDTVPVAPRSLTPLQGYAHPAIEEAERATELPLSGWLLVAAAALIFAAVVVASSVWPWGFAS